MWHNKGSRDGFVWFVCNSARSTRRTCRYSKSKNHFCRAKLRIATNANEHGQYVVESDSSGYEHLMSEILDRTDDSEHVDDASGPPNITNSSVSSVYGETADRVPVNVEVPDTNLLNGETKVKQWKENWDELANLLMRNVQISPKKAPPSQLKSQPPQIIAVAKTNGRIDWETLVAHSDLKMVIARMTIGSQVDREFRYNFRFMSTNNFEQIGVYHYFLGGTDASTPEEQFQVIIKTLDDVGFNRRKNLFAIAVQTERNADFTPLVFTARLIAFINLMLRAGFMRPIIYCNNNSWKQLIDPSVDDKLFSELPLWIAHYTDKASPKYPGTWKSRGIPWWMWHYTDMGVMNGIITPVYLIRRNESYIIKDDLFYSAI